ncbi:MAG: thermostable hemolysin [Gammaproteobacteria bacterium]
MKLAAWLGDDTSCSLPAGARLAFYEAGDCGRDRIERYISEVFARNYSARLRHFKPRLLAMFSEDGEILAALGLRNAATERLFLETYLDAPVERRMTALCGRMVARQGIVEIGNLASRHPGRARCLFRALTIHLYRNGSEWALFTMAPFLRNTFRKLGFQLLPLGPADKARLGDAAADWGSYYDGRPQVMAVNVEQAFLAVMASYENAGAAALQGQRTEPASDSVVTMARRIPPQSS